MTNIKQENQEEQGTSLKFSDLGISDSILKALERLNLDKPTPIQHKTIPAAISGQDIIGIAQTGTGKTFAYGIPMLQRLGQTKGQGLVIAPTRELALQVEESLKKLGHALGLRTAILIGGESLDRQLFQLRKKPHVVVATPGRLIDHLTRKTLKLDQVNTLVLDEADMMLDMGFAPQIQEILKQVPKERQTMLFSATMPEAIVKIAATYMKLPVSIEVAPPGTTADQIDQEIFIINGEERFEHLQKILAQYKGSVLVFLRTKHGVKGLTAKLQAAGQKATEIHSNLSLNRRRAALNDFKTGKMRILIATDVAARGLDINGIELVVNYNLPDNSDDYVHRIGRTARAGKAGKAITFATANEQREIRDIERLINQEIKRTEFVKFSKDSTSASAGSRKRGSFRNERQPFQKEGRASFKRSERAPFKREERKPFRRDDNKPFIRELKPRAEGARFYGQGFEPFKGDAGSSRADAKPFSREAKPFRSEARPFKKDFKPFNKDARSNKPGRQGQAAPVMTDRQRHSARNRFSRHGRSDVKTDILFLNKI